MSKFLLDENLSPRVGYALSNLFGFDVVSILKLNMARTPDREIGVFAGETGRVLITLDEDFANYFHRSANPGFRVIYLDISNDFRYNNEIIKKLFRLLSESSSRCRS